MVSNLNSRRRVSGASRSARLFGALILVAGIALMAPRACAADNELTEAEARDGWLLIFDGRSTAGWMTSDRTPSKTAVEQGSLQPHQSGHYMLVHTQQWGNFVLKLDFKISPKCNSGVFVRTAPLDRPRPGLSRSPGRPSAGRSANSIAASLSSSAIASKASPKSRSSPAPPFRVSAPPTPP